MKLALLDFPKPKVQILLRVYDEKSIYLHQNCKLYDGGTFIFSSNRKNICGIVSFSKNHKK